MVGIPPLQAGKEGAMTTRIVDPREIMEQVGQALFGRKWRAELGDSFKPVVSMRTINRMMANPPTGVTREPHRQQMLALIDKRMKTLDSLRKSVADQPAYPEALE